MVAIVYQTMSQQTQKFVDKIEGYDKINLEDNPNVTMNQPYILVVPSYEQNVLPFVFDIFDEFLEVGDNLEYCHGIFATGNRNFGELFATTGHELSEDFDIPVLHELEFQGSETDVEKLEEELKIANNHTKTNKT